MSYARYDEANPPSSQHAASPKQDLLGTDASLSSSTSPVRQTYVSGPSSKLEDSSSPLVEAAVPDRVKYQDKLDSIYGVSDSKSSPGMSLLEVALSKCNAISWCTISYDLTWELPSYLKKSFPSRQPLGGILTLTGGTLDAYGSSCKDYLNNIFPDVGPCVLECLEEMLLDSKDGRF